MIAMQPAVLLDQRRRLASEEPGEQLRARLGAKRRVELRDGGAHALDEQHVAVVLAFRRAAVWADVEAVGRGVAKLGEPSERGFLDMALGDARTHSAASTILLGVFHADFAGHQLRKEEVAGGDEGALLACSASIAFNQRLIVGLNAYISWTAQKLMAFECCNQLRRQLGFHAPIRRMWRTGQCSAAER